jgi:hypothetical protein
MIKFLSGFALTFSFLFVSASVSKAQSNSPSMSASLEKQKSEARLFVSRTAQAVLEAQPHVLKGGVSQGDFATAVHHIRHAIELYKSANYRRAAMHADLARKSAVRSCNANKGSISSNLTSLNEQEKSILHGPVLKDEELRTEVSKLLKLKPTISDAALLKSDLNDLKPAQLNTLLK